MITAQMCAFLMYELYLWRGQRSLYGISTDDGIVWQSSCPSPSRVGICSLGYMCECVRVCVTWEKIACVANICLFSVTEVCRATVVFVQILSILLIRSWSFEEKTATTSTSLQDRWNPPQCAWVRVSPPMWKQFHPLTSWFRVQNTGD